MPPTTDYDSMLSDMSNHLSRSQLLRRLSTHSSNTSGSSKRGTARITKQHSTGSAGSSPHTVPRRRTTACHNTKSYPRVSQDCPYQNREQWLRTYYSSREALPMARPMSWHPSSELNRRRAQMPTSEPTLGNTIVGLENLAVSNTPASVQQSIENAFAMGYGYPIAKPASMYEPSPMQTGGYDNVHACAESACNPYASYDTLEPYHYSETSTALTYAIYPPASNQVPQWPPVEPEITNNQLVAPQEPVDCLPMQWPTDAHQNLYFTSAPELPKKTSKELVGMGLYDNEDRDFMSTIHSAISDDPIRDSMGKGLKLEETWQPPVKDGDDDGDDEGGEDSDSTDEAEEVEEDSPVVSSAPAETPIASYPTYGDLSDKSFFFNEDEQYPGEDQYTTYLAYGQGIPAVQPKIHHSASWQLPMGLKGFRS